MDKCYAVCDIASGICARLHFFTSDFITRKDTYLQLPEFLKLRQRIEKKYPDLSDMRKVDGYEKFQERAQSIYDHLQTYADILLDIADINEVILHVLSDLMSSVCEYNLELNRQLCLMYCEILVTYMRLHLLFASVHDRKVLYGFYCLACAEVKGIANPDIIKVNPLIEAAEAYQRHFIDVLLPFSGPIGIILQQFRDSIISGNDYDALQNKGVIKKRITI